MFTGCTLPEGPPSFFIGTPETISKKIGGLNRALIMLAPQGKGPKAPRVYTEEEVNQHKSSDDCWVTVHGKVKTKQKKPKNPALQPSPFLSLAQVYDVSVYMHKHPGGSNLIFRSAGEDVTKDFEAMFHSIRARKKLEELYIGDLKGHSAPNTLSPWSAPAGRKVGTKALNSAPSAGRGPYGLGPPQSGLTALPGRGVSLSTKTFTRLTVVGVREEKETHCKVLTLSLPNLGVLTIKPSQHVRVKWGSIMRSYTPIKWKPGSFELLVKPYPGLIF
jgi:hypothetical protein